MNKRIILCGPAASGKDYMKSKFRKRGFKIDCSYTTRPIRNNEIEGKTYHYISYREFDTMIAENKFYEFAKHGDYLYGTGLKEWNECDIFIMETDGIADIEPEDRESCFVIYLNPPKEIRKERLRKERGWDDENINHRANTDDEKFKDFTDYDLEITNPNF